MKKVLLFAAFALILGGLTAQTVHKTTPVKSSEKWFELRDGSPDPELPFTTNFNHNLRAQKNPISSSGNVYTLLVPESSCLSYNKDLGALSFIHRADPSAGIGSITGNIVASYSSTYGILWDQILVTNDAKNNRYPSGVIYNPTGNLDLAGAYVALSGPVTDGSAWVENFWASARLDSSNQTVTYEDYATYDQEFPRLGFTACDDGKLHVMGTKYVFTSGVGVTSYSHVTMNTGAFNAVNTAFDWTRVDVSPKFAQLSFDGALEVSSYSSAWSQDGTIGYMYFIGIDSAYNQTSYQPILYKTTNSGLTWTKQPDFDFRTINAIQSSIWSTLANDTVARPFFAGECEAVVDNNGDFHMFGIITGAYSTHPDSLGYTFLFEPNKLFHTWTTATGWDAEFIATIYTNSVSTTDALFGTGADATGWDHRVQAARSYDGSKVFCVWSDTDTLYAIMNASNRLINSSPDLYAWGKDLGTSTVYPVTNYTAGTSLEAECYFHYVSEVIIQDGTNQIIPVTISEIDLNSSTGPLNPTYHYYVTNVGYGPTIGLNEVEKVPVMDVSNIYPNPSTGLTNVDIDLLESTDVLIRVYDISGRLVYSADHGQLAAGLHTLTMSIDNAAPGMYICNVNAGSKNITRKLSIK